MIRPLQSKFCFQQYVQFQHSLVYVQIYNKKCMFSNFCKTKFGKLMKGTKHFRNIYKSCKNMQLSNRITFSNQMYTDRSYKQVKLPKKIQCCHENNLDYNRHFVSSNFRILRHSQLRVVLCSCQLGANLMASNPTFLSLFSYEI